MSLDPKFEHGSRELDWQAFCYIADEMTELQRQEFEGRLAEDQKVRDAVVRAMELGELAYHCLEPSLSNCDLGQTTTGLGPVVEHRVAGWTSRRTAVRASNRRKPGILFAVAVCIGLLAAGWAWQLSQTGEHDSVTAMTMDVADAWSNLADWDDAVTLESELVDPVLLDDNPLLTSGLGEKPGEERTWDPAGNGVMDDHDTESGNWMLVALMDLEREEGSDSK